MAKLIMLVTLTVDKLGILVFRVVADVADKGSCKNSKKENKNIHAYWKTWKAFFFSFCSVEAHVRFP